MTDAQFILMRACQMHDWDTAFKTIDWLIEIPDVVKARHLYDEEKTVLHYICELGPGFLIVCLFA